MNIHVYLHFAVSLLKTQELGRCLNYACRITPNAGFLFFFLKNYTNNRNFSFLSLKQLSIVCCKANSIVYFHTSNKAYENINDSSSLAHR